MLKFSIKKKEKKNPTKYLHHRISNYMYATKILVKSKVGKVLNFKPHIDNLNFNQTTIR